MATDEQISAEAKRSRTFARQMLRKIEDAMLKAAGAKSVTVDGVAVTYDDLMRQHRYWKAEVARENGQRPWASTINLSQSL